MKRALAIALLALILSAGASFAVPANASAGTHSASIEADDLGPLSETDIDALVGARRTVCSLDISIARHYFATGNVVGGALWLLVAHLRPALCS